MGKLEDRFISVLDMNKVFSTEQTREAEKTSAALMRVDRHICPFLLRCVVPPAMLKSTISGL